MKPKVRVRPPYRRGNVVYPQAFDFIATRNAEMTAELRHIAESNAGTEMVSYALVVWDAHCMWDAYIFGNDGTRCPYNLVPWFAQMALSRVINQGDAYEVFQGSL